MSKYKIGDKVKIREDLVVGKNYGKHMFINDMVEFKGTEVIISRMDYYNEGYILGGRGFIWTDEMIEGLVEDKPKYKIRDKIEITQADCIDKGNGIKVGDEAIIISIGELGSMRVRFTTGNYNKDYVNYSKNGYLLSFNQVKLVDKEANKPKSLNGFTVGDRVMVSDENIKGKGTIIGINDSRNLPIAIEFDKPIGRGHRFSGAFDTPYHKVTDGHGWWVKDKNIEEVVNTKTDTNSKAKYVKCITDEFLCIDKDKIYEVVSESQYNYIIKIKFNDTGSYSKYHFVEVDSPIETTSTPITKSKSTKGVIKYKIKNNVTTVKLNGKVGKATRNSIDEPNDEIGILIATCRVLGIDETKINDIIDILFDDDTNSSAKCDNAIMKNDIARALSILDKYKE